jgi:hypothetical protein
VKSRLALAFSITVIAAGCGASAHPRATSAQQVKLTVRTALRDLANGDGQAFCALATPAGRAKLAGTLHGYTCPALVGLVAGHLSPETRAALRHVQVSAVTVHGATATVEAADITATVGSLKGFLNDGGTPTSLVRQRDGSWRING